MSRCSFPKLFKHPELLQPATSGVSRVLFGYKASGVEDSPGRGGFYRWERETKPRLVLALLMSKFFYL
jgi:hypothetical protein